MLLSKKAFLGGDSVGKEVAREVVKILHTVWRPLPIKLYPGIESPVKPYIIDSCNL